VLASEGYPDDPVTGRELSGLDEAEQVDGVTIAHASTALVDGRYLATGGRVLGVVARGTDFRHARANAYEALDRIHLEGGQFRHDIAERVAR
jgi:phosphoribosylamine---glycine ligase